MKNNNFVKEYITEGKDQFYLDYAIFRKDIEETATRHELIQYMDERLNKVISMVASERTKTPMEDSELI